MCPYCHQSTTNNVWTMVALVEPKPGGSASDQLVRSSWQWYGYCLTWIVLAWTMKAGLISKSEANLQNLYAWFARHCLKPSSKRPSLIFLPMNTIVLRLFSSGFQGLPFTAWNCSWMPYKDFESFILLTEGGPMAQALTSGEEIGAWLMNLFAK